MSATSIRAGSKVGADGTERLILVRVDRAIGIGEGELRYQLEHKHDHPLARAPELLDVLAALEERGLLVSELCFRLTAVGRERLDAVGDERYGALSPSAGRAG
jgi:hypothetical protein